jgi:hypothetical protein
MTLKIYAAIAAIIAAPTVAFAEMPDDGKGRYALSTVDGGVMRLDKDTGAMTLCTRKADQWACEAVQDRSQEDRERVAKLENENNALKDRIRSLEQSLTSPPGAAGKPGTAETPPGDAAQLPSEKDVDKAFDYVEGMIKKLRERIQKYEHNDPTKPADPDAKPL